MITSIHCNYSVPLSFAGVAPAVSEPFAFSQSDCTTTATTSEQLSTTTIQGYNGPNEAEFLIMFAILLFIFSIQTWPRFSVLNKKEK